MTSHTQISTSLHSHKKASNSRLNEGPLSFDEVGSYANTFRFHDRNPFLNLTPDEASLAVRLAAEELALAAQIHSELMSIRLPSVSYARLTGKMIPCRAIGGDFFDAVALSDATCAVVADVSGKGIPAAIVAAMLQGIIHAEILSYQPLTTIATTVNEFLCSRTTGKFATMVLLKIWENGKLEYLNCGHIPPLVVNDAKLGQLAGSNTVVGLIPAAQYTSETCSLVRGDRIMIFTDGITEAENSHGEQFGDSAIERGLSSVDSVFEQLSKFQGGVERSDDCTLFELQYQGVTLLSSSSR
jgi:sigma-B regulation protein RsbU (phosphoserine phosphatase)